MPGIIALARRAIGWKPIPKEKCDDEWKEAFNIYDKNKNGFIEKGELKDTLTHLLGAQPTQIQIDKIFAKVDLNGDGKISYEEFYNMMQEREKKKMSAREDAETNFQVFDLDKNGYITKAELAQVLNRLEGSDVEQAEIDQLIDMVDQDDDKRINLEEFLDFFVV